MRRCLALVLGGVFLAQSGLASDVVGDPEAGKSKIGQCRTCHGSDGYAKIPIAPHIGGEPASYLSAQLTAFRDGARVHEMMSVVAAGLSDQDIADLAAWYASHTATATLPASANPDAAPDTCVGCHGVDGLSVAEDAPNLSGETSMYIDTQLKAVRTGKRTHDIMTGIAADLSNDEIRALANWYAGVKLEITPPAE